MYSTDRISDTLSTAMNRRSILKTLAGTGAAALTLRAMTPAFANHTAQTYTVSSNANFRSGPGTSFSIISVIYKGAPFQINGQVQNGYAGIIYNGKSGWVLASLVVAAGSTGSDPVITGQAFTSSAVNLRSGPGTTYSVLRVVPGGSRIGTSTTVTNGYRYVTHNGLAGWMSDTYISFSAGEGPVPAYQTTTANLNLREQPNTTSKILLVIPVATKVVPTGAFQINFAQVTYNGVKGWVSMAYLK
jgi:uncharacterized protein YraI